MPSKPSAFISYRRADSAALATLIAVTLKDKYGIDTFVDTRNTDGGGPFPDRLRRAIEACNVFVCLLGATTLESVWVQEEIEYAHNLRKTMIPIIQERYVPPNPIPNEQVQALLQSDGIQILDVRNIYVDQAITDLALMVKRSVIASLPPPPAPKRLSIWFALLALIALIIVGLWQIFPGLMGVRLVSTETAQVVSGVTPDFVSDAPDPTSTATPTEDAAATQIAIQQVTLTALADLQTYTVQTATADSMTRIASRQIEATRQTAQDTATAVSLAITQSIINETQTRQALNAIETWEANTATSSARNATETANVWTDTPTPSITPTPFPTITFTPAPPTSTLDSTLRGMSTFNPVTENSQWTPIINNFDNVPMVLAPVGCFMMGSDDQDNERPINEQCFQVPFWIDLYEVTYRQYGQEVAIGNDDLPIEVTWEEARSFCERRNTRLPSEREWEYAARGPNNLIYPWGNEFVAANARWGMVFAPNPTMPVGSHPNGVSWVGALDMSGNIWEWVSSLYVRYPYNLNDGRENPESEGVRARRGGSYASIDQSSLRGSYRDSISSVFTSGFRCARDFDG